MIKRPLPVGRRGHITHAGVLLGVPVLLAAAVWLGGRAPAVTPSAESATMWLVAADGRLVRANALVASPTAQIVEAISFTAARSGVRLLPTSHGLVAAAANGSLAAVDTGAHRVAAETSGPTAALTTDGRRLYRAEQTEVAILDPGNLRELASYPMGVVVASAAAPGALYVATVAGDLVRVTEAGVARVLELGAAPRLASLADGVAILDDGGRIRVSRAGGSNTVATVGVADPTAFSAAPDGQSFAVVAGRRLVMVADGRTWSRELTFTPEAAPVLDDGVVYVADPDARTLRSFRAAEGLPDRETLSFGQRGPLHLDVHRNREFIWFDDVRGPHAWVVHQGRARKITKFGVRVRSTSPRPSATTTPPPTTRPSSSPPSSSPTTRPPSTSRPPQTTRPATASPSPSPSPSPSLSKSSSRSPSPSPSPSKTPSRSSSPTPTGDPLEACGGELTALEVDNRDSTGPQPRIAVTICERASGGDEYWIVSLSGGQWFAKRQVTRSRTYTVVLRHGSGEPGQDRDFLIVAGRTSAGRSWLRANLAADIAGDGAFPRDDLAGGVDIVSDRVSTTS